MPPSARPAPPAYCRVSVLAPGRRVDVALPGDVPVGELVPMLLELLGGLAGSGRDGRRLRPWRLTGAAGGQLPPDATLDELGVLDGELLRLAPAAPPPAAPMFDDPADALAATAGGGIGRAPRGWPAAAVLGTAVTAAAVLGGVRAGPADGAVVAGAVALGVLGVGAALWRAAVLARRAAAVTPDGPAPDGPTPDGPTPDDTAPDGPAPDGPASDGAAPDTPADGGGAPDAAAGRSAAVVTACCAVVLAAGAGWAALPGPPGAAHLLLAAAAAGVVAAAGQVVLRMVAPALIAGVFTAVPVAAAALLRLRFGVAPGALAAGTAALALAAGPLLPRAALSLAGVPRPRVPADGAELVAAAAGPDRLPAELGERAVLARGHLAGLSGGCAVVAAAAGLAAAGTAGASGIALAVVVAVVLALRARGLADPVPAGLHLAAGITTGVALTVLAAAWSGPAGRLVAALALLAAAGAGTAGLGRGLPEVSPVTRRAVDLLEGLLTAAAIPLALAAAGLFGLVRGL